MAAGTEIQALDVTYSLKQIASNEDWHLLCRGNVLPSGEPNGINSPRRSTNRCEILRK